MRFTRSSFRAKCILLDDSFSTAEKEDIVAAIQKLGAILLEQPHIEDAHPEATPLSNNKINSGELRDNVADNIQDLDRGNTIVPPLDLELVYSKIGREFKITHFISNRAREFRITHKYKAPARVSIQWLLDCARMGKWIEEYETIPNEVRSRHPSLKFDKKASESSDNTNADREQLDKPTEDIAESEKDTPKASDMDPEPSSEAEEEKKKNKTATTKKAADPEHSQKNKAKPNKKKESTKPTKKRKDSQEHDDSENNIPSKPKKPRKSTKKLSNAKDPCPEKPDVLSGMKDSGPANKTPELITGSEDPPSQAANREKLASRKSKKKDSNSSDKNGNKEKKKKQMKGVPAEGDKGTALAQTNDSAVSVDTAQQAQAQAPPSPQENATPKTGPVANKNRPDKKAAQPDTAMAPPTNPASTTTTTKKKRSNLHSIATLNTGAALSSNKKQRSETPVPSSKGTTRKAADKPKEPADISVAFEEKLAGQAKGALFDLF
eukprot:GEZU01020186.1.p1 GENE.GEZU01020186.1~~GEZU01020186.1.p1  ORF type:complete len:503 (+),score=136.33 GEZU01020186.1:32-1510(+)